MRKSVKKSMSKKRVVKGVKKSMKRRLISIPKMAIHMRRTK